MKKLLYNTIKIWMRTGLHSYYRRLDVSGLANIPLDKPVLFLPNHQSALLDVLLIAVDCNRKPFFLTRSDVFGNKFLNGIFSFFRMMPIYRLRDGRNALSKNEAVFDRCAEVLQKGESIVMFPEANHNIKRRVRPLSKGFTRVLFRALEVSPDLDIHIIPVGLNYKTNSDFPDEVAIYYGKPILVQTLYDPKDLAVSRDNIKDEVTKALKRLTTDIPLEDDYDRTIAYLQSKNADFLKPEEVNNLIANMDQEDLGTIKAVDNKQSAGFLYPLFVLINLPVILLWKLYMKPKVWEPEFTGTLRFATALIGFEIYYALLLFILGIGTNWTLAFLVVFAIYFFNYGYVKFGRFPKNTVNKD